MVRQKFVNDNVDKNCTPDLSVESLIKQAGKSLKKFRKTGVKKKGEGKPYWQPVKGTIRWEKRVHYYDDQGIRRTRLLETRKHKPRDI